MKKYFTALTIAGSDSGGAAGIQADLKTFSALGCYGMSVITAVTAQNTEGVRGIHPVPPEHIALQIDAVLGDIGADVIKIGMLHSQEVISTVTGRLRHHSCRRIIVDPVMESTSGAPLLSEDGISMLKSRLIPMAELLTPNLPEASVLLGRSVTSYDQMEDACRELANLGCRAILLKGGHLEGNRCVDMLFDARSGQLQEFLAERVVTENSHGTGCTISSAIAAFLARGLALKDAVPMAKEYIERALIAGSKTRIGHGRGPVHHFHDWWSL